MRSTFVPTDARELFRDLPHWWIAGGWAIDLWLGGTTREHADLDIAILRRDQGTFRERMNDWDLHLVTAPGVLTPLENGPDVPEPLHAIWCRPTATSEWAFELLLNDSNETDWLFRRDHAVRMPLDGIGRTARDGVPHLAPEIVLLYKAKNVREHDVDDFEVALPSLGDRQRTWLRESIGALHPGHPWLERLG